MLFSDLKRLIHTETALQMLNDNMELYTDILSEPQYLQLPNSSKFFYIRNSSCQIHQSSHKKTYLRPSFKLKVVFPLIITPYQGAFMQNRLVLNGVLLVNKLSDSRKRSRRVGGILKLTLKRRITI
eukprot:TRINITY_DN12686_c0_g1_i5.p1 TRINITY_DN12686_c0_g1~~TRINITY_DN12686_c0_g1_i5.p1  ORF type:complete len:126 (-),score=1.47 TRINITY_DN12686_c0_g1_i5:2050-2427(-)